MNRQAGRAPALLALLLMATVLLTGCAWSVTRQAEQKAAWEAQLTSWIGQPVEALVQRVGYPARTLTGPNGNTVYVFEYRHSGSTPHLSYSVGQRGKITWGPTTYSYYELRCTTYFEVDAEQRVVAWRYEGNAYSLPHSRASE